MELIQRKWRGAWISDPTYQVKSPESPVPMVFRRHFSARQPVDSLHIFATALGVFDLWLDGKLVCEEYFNPGFTDYNAHLQYVRHELKAMPAGSHELLAVVAGGWSVGRTTHVDDTNKSRSKLSAERLWMLIRENGVHPVTGFPATPYLLFALADQGYEQEAYQLLFQDADPSWLYPVKHGATTMWEQWGSVREDGSIRESSLNHYAYGAVGEFLYRRVCGLEITEPGYRRFRVKPLADSRLTWAECTHESPLGRIAVRWEIQGDKMLLRVEVPAGTTCDVILPDGKQTTVGGGIHEYTSVQ